MLGEEEGALAAKMAETNEDTRARRCDGRLGLFIGALAVAFSLFHIYFLGFAHMESIKFRMIHITGVIALIMLIFPAHKNSPRSRPSFMDWVLFATTITVGFYSAFVNIDAVASRGGGYVQLDVALGIITILLILEGTRRTTGYILVALALASISFALLGSHLPGFLRHAGFPPSRVASYLYMGSDGILGMITGISASIIFLFCLLGAFVAKSGMTDFFSKLALSLAGSSPGGPAKVVVLCSGLVGTISTSATANVATTGLFSIPLMKKLGYSNHYAAAVEATASTGSQITPPVLGAAAFLIAEFLGISYIEVAMAAILPCLLYYLCCWVSVHLRARKTGMLGLPKEQLPNTKELLLEQWYLVIPVLVIITLLALRYTLTHAAMLGILMTVAISWLSKNLRMKPKDVLTSLKDGAFSALSVCMACILVGIIVGVFSMTGLATRLSGAVAMVTFAQGPHGIEINILLGLLLTMLMTLILGLGLPTSVAFVITATVAVPILVRIDIAPLAAHFFVFYFAVMAGITPPIAIVAYVAAAIAGACPTKTALASVRLALAGFVIPFIFVYSPELLLQSGSFFAIVQAFVRAAACVVLLAIALEGFFMTQTSWWMRIIALTASMLLVMPGLETSLIAAAAAIFIYFFQRKKARQKDLSPAVYAAGS